MEHLKLFSTRLNVPQLIRVCEELELWRELTFLYVAYDEYDNALGVMITHSPLAWEHVQASAATAALAPLPLRFRFSRVQLIPARLPGPRGCFQFKDVAVKVKAADTLYKGVSFYLEEHPDLLNDLLKVGRPNFGRNALHRALLDAHSPRLCDCVRCPRMQVVEARVDHSRVVDIMRRAAQLPLVKDYLLSVQKNNLLAVRLRPDVPVLVCCA